MSPSADSRDSDQKAADTALDRIAPMVAPDVLPQVRTILREVVGSVTEHHSGPLPRAGDLAEYNVIDASFAERIVRMAEKEQEFQHGLPREYLTREYDLKSRGQICAMAITALVLAFAALLAVLGDTRMAGMVAMGTLVGLVSVLVTGRAIDAIGERRRTADDTEPPQ